jgi:hypothetical protein
MTGLARPDIRCGNDAGKVLERCAAYQSRQGLVLQFDAAEVAVRVARGADDSSGTSAAGAAMYGWTEKHAITCFLVHRSLRSCVRPVTRVTSEPRWRPGASATRRTQGRAVIKATYYWSAGTKLELIMEFSRSPDKARLPKYRPAAATAPQGRTLRMPLSSLPTGRPAYLAPWAGPIPFR